MSQTIHKLVELLESNKPNKKELIIQFMESQVTKSQTNTKTSKTTSSLKKKSKPTYDSPSTRFRKRALQKMYQEEAGSSKPSKEIVSSSSSTASSASSLVPLDKVLTGVIAFVDVMSKGEDRSFVIKAFLTSMGATVRDELTKDVTHVIFKNGSYTTLQKTKYIKAHFVSILWIQACRTQRVRVREKHYPALGAATYEHDMSLLYSELQEDYNELIREEYNTTSTSLPFTQSNIDRRRTTNSIISFSQCSTPSNPKRKSLSSQRMYSDDGDDDDDSDTGAVIDGNIVEKEIKRTLNFSDMDITNNIISDEFKENANSSNPATPGNSDSVYGLKTPQIYPGSQRLQINGDNSDLFDSPTPDDDLYTKSTPKIALQAKNMNVTDDEDILVLSIDKRTTELKETGRELFSNLNQSKILSKNSTKEPPVEKSSSMSTLSLSSDKSKEKSTESYMSSLRLSSDHSANSRLLAEKSKETNQEPTNTLKRKHVIPENPANNDDSESEESPSKRRNILNVPEKKTGDDKVKEIRVVLTRVNSLNKVTSEEYITACDESPVKEKKKRKLRKLYNPDGSFNISVDDEAEREMAKLKAREAEKKDQTSSVKPRRDITVSLLSNRKFRKLYNPDEDDSDTSLDDEAERAKRRLKAKEAAENKTDRINSSQQSIILSGKMTEFFKNNMELFVKLDSLMGKKYPTKQAKNTKKRAVIDDERDEQKELFEEIMREKNKKKDTPAKPPTADEDKKKATPAKPTTADEDKKKATPAKPSTTATDKEKKATHAEPTAADKDKKKATPAKPSTTATDKEKKATHAEPTAADKDKKKATPAKPSTTATDKEKKATPAKPSTTATDRDKNATPANPPTTKERRKSLRPLIKTPIRFGSTSDKQNMVTPRSNRRSTMEFQTKAEMSAKIRLKIDKLKRPTIVCSMLHGDQIQKFNTVVKTLGGFVTENLVSKKTTHLVLGEPKRTINLLKAVARGCWVLKYEWLLQSSETGKWLPEEDFEETSISPAIEQCRLQRKAFGPSYSMDIFQECGYIYIKQNTSPKRTDLIDLIELCKGKVTTMKRNAAIVIGQPNTLDSPGEIYVKETWVLDSIIRNKKLSLRKYYCNV